MNASLSCVVLAIVALAAGCANQPAPTPQLNLDRAIVTQVVQEGLDQYVTCIACPARSPKYFPPKPEKPAQVVTVQPPVLIPQSQTQAFKVHFRFGSHSLDSTGKQEITQIVSALSNQRLLRISIEGRTDPVGTLQYNKGLAKRRAETVARLLKAKLSTNVPIETAVPDSCCRGGEKLSHREQRRTDVIVNIESTKL